MALLRDIPFDKTPLAEWWYNTYESMKTLDSEEWEILDLSISTPPVSVTTEDYYKLFKMVTVTISSGSWQVGEIFQDLYRYLLRTKYRKPLARYILSMSYDGFVKWLKSDIGNDGCRAVYYLTQFSSEGLEHFMSFNSNSKLLSFIPNFNHLLPEKVPMDQSRLVDINGKTILYTVQQLSDNNNYLISALLITQQSFIYSFLKENPVIRAEAGELDFDTYSEDCETQVKDVTLNSIVADLLSLISSIDRSNFLTLLNKAELLIFTGMSISCEKFWIKIMSGLGALYGLSANKSLLASIGPLMLDKVFGTKNLTESSVYLTGLETNLRHSKIYDIIAFCLIPFKTDINLSVGEIQVLHVKCAEEIRGLELVKAVVTASDFLTDAIDKIKVSRNLAPLGMPSIGMSELLKRYSEINEEYLSWTNNPGITPLFGDRIMELEVLLKDLKSAMSKTRDIQVVKHYSNLIAFSTKMLSCYQAKSHMGEFRSTPYAFSLFGPSQVGKSSLTSYILKHIASLLNIDKTPVTVRGDEKFFDHVNNDDELLIIDDVANVQPDFAERSPVDILLRLRNNVATPLDQAAIERKGKICPHFKAIALTTNISDFNSSAYSIMSSSIVQRVNIHITLEVKPEFSTNGVLDSSKVSQVYTDSDIPNDIWNISMFSVRVKPGAIPYRTDYVNNYVIQDTPWYFEPIVYSGRTMLKVGLADALDCITYTVNKHFSTQEKVLQGLFDVDLSQVFCYTCQSRREFCSCCFDNNVETQSGVSVVPNMSIKKRMLDPLTQWFTSLANYSFDTAISSLHEEVDGNIGAMFGVRVSRKRFHDRMKLLLEFGMRLIEETRYLHVATYLPSEIYDSIDKNQVILALESDKIANEVGKFSASYWFSLIVYFLKWLHFGITGFILGFLIKIFSGFSSRRSLSISIPKHPLIKSFVMTILVFTYCGLLSAVYSRWREIGSNNVIFYGVSSPFIHYTNVSPQFKLFVDRGTVDLKLPTESSRLDSLIEDEDVVIMRGIKRLSTKIKNKVTRKKRVPVYEKIKKEYEEIVLTNFSWILIFTYVFSSLYFFLDYIQKTDEFVKSYTTKTVFQIDRARIFIRPYISTLKKRLTAEVETQSGKDEFYVKEWEIFNKERFEVNRRNISEAQSVISHNLVNVTYDKQTAMGIVLRTGRMLLPAHFIPNENKLATVVRYPEANIGNRKFLVSLSRSMCIPIPNKDLVVYQFVEGGTFSDISNLFPENIHNEVPSGIRYHRSLDGELCSKKTFSHNDTPVRTSIFSFVHGYYIQNAMGFEYECQNGTGLCGSPIFSGYKNTYIKGVHIAGDSYNRDRSFGIPVLKSEISKALSTEPKMYASSLELSSAEVNPWGFTATEEVPTQSPSLYIADDRQFGFLGRIGGYNVPSNKVHRHAISEFLESQGFPCKWGSPIVKGQPRYKSTKRWLDKVTSQKRPVDPDILMRARDDYMRPLITLFEGNERCRVLNRKEIANGAPGEVFINRLDMSSGTGYPYRMKKHKLATISPEGVVIFPEYIWDEVAFIEKSLENSHMPRIPATVTGKMEVRKIGKGERKFCDVPLCLTLLMRKYFCGVFSVLVENRELSECAVGINPYSSEWDQLYKSLDQGIGTEWHAEDIGKFDQSVIVMLFHAIGTIFVEFAAKAGYNHRSLHIMRGLISMISNPTAIVDGDLLELSGLMLSGIFGTTHMDSGMISLMKRYTFFKVYGLDNSLCYKDYCRLVTFGDDAVETTRGLWKYNSLVYSKLWMDHGIEVTTANKDPITKRNDNFSDVSFIKRNFRYCSIRKRWVGCLETDSILKSLHCYCESKFVSPEDVLRINLERSVIEFSYHTEEVFNEFMSVLMKLPAPYQHKMYSWSYSQVIEFQEQKILDFGIPILEDYKGVRIKVQAGELKTTGDSEIQETAEIEVDHTAGTSALTTMSREIRSDNNLSLNEFLERPVILGRLETTSITGPTDLIFDPWTALLNNVRNANRISNYFNFAADFEFTVLVTSTPFYYGQFALYYYPIFSSDENDFLSSLDYPFGNVLIFQQQHILIDVTEDKGGKLVIPFFYYRDFVNLTAEFDSIGRLALRNITPLRYVGDVPTAPMTIVIMGRFTNIRTRGLTHTNIDGISPQSGELEEKGPVSRIASAVSNIAHGISNIPIIGRYALATELVASAVGATARLFGFSRPFSIEEDKRVITRPMGDMAVTNVCDNTNKLSVDVRQQLTVDPLAGGISNIDQLSIGFLAGRRSYLTSFSWTSAASYNTPLGFVRVDPTFHLRTPIAGELIIPSLAAVSLPFDFYTGHIKYTFSVVCSRFHRGRLLIQYDPNDNDAVIDPVINLNTNLCYEVDIENSKEVSLIIGPSKSWTYLKNYGILTSSSSYFSSTVVTGNYNKFYGNGTINIMVLNPLSYPSTAIGSPVTILVYAEAMEDFKLAKPNFNVGRLTPSFPTGALRAEAGEFGSELMTEEPKRLKGTGSVHNNIDLDYMGETVNSLRQLAKRYTFVRSYIDTTGPTSSYYWILTLPSYPFYNLGTNFVFPGDSSAVGSLTYYQYCALLFHGTRGSLRYKAFPNISGPLGSGFTTQVTWDGSGPSGAFYRNAVGTITYHETAPDTIVYKYVTYGTYTGCCVGFSDVNSSLEFEIPFQSHHLFAVPRKDSEINEFNRMTIVTQGYMDGTKQKRMDLYSSAGEDFQVYWFRGLPPMKYIDF